MKRAFNLIEALVVIAIILFLASILFPVFWGRRGEEGGRSVCQTNLKQIGLGIAQYTQDAGERFPPVTAKARGWAELIHPYTKSTQIFQCDMGINGETNSLTTDYFYNRRLARVSLNQINDVAYIVLSGDGEDNAPTWNSWSGLPADVLKNPNSPARRHLDGANYLFADGHVKWLNPDKILNASSKPDSGYPSFAIR